MLGTADNLAYYGVAFNIYSYLLNICTAGFPFAIATLIAKYSLEGLSTSLLIKKLSASLMTCFGFDDDYRNSVFLSAGCTCYAG